MDQHSRSDRWKLKQHSLPLMDAVSATFRRLMDLVLARLQWINYLDDVAVIGKTFFAEYLESLRAVVEHLQDSGLKQVCSLFAPS